MSRPPVETITLNNDSNEEKLGVVQEFAYVSPELLWTRHKYAILGLSIAIVAMLVANTVGQVYLNNWQGAFYSAIERKNLHEIGHQMLVFAVLISIVLTVVVTQTWLHQILKITLRKSLTGRLLDFWMHPGRAYRLSMGSDDSIQPDQRLQEDARNFAEMTSDLVIGVIQSALLLVTFLGVLWKMSENVTLKWSGQALTIPGYMVWVAIAYAMIGSYLTARAGRALIRLNDERYTQEANLRFSILRMSESAESVAFYGGERDERRNINQALAQILAVMGRFSFAFSRLIWIQNGYGLFMLVLPVLVALPGYMQGTLNLGGLMMVVGAFNQVSQSLRWFVDNFGRIADWRASLHRVAVFKEAVETIDAIESSEARIQLVEHPEGHLSFEGTMVSLMDGEVVIDNATAHIAPGERVLITGESGSGKSTLFRAVAGLWPWGSGIIRLPPKDSIMFLPQRPYMPLGTLADAVAYPFSGHDFDQQDLAKALRRVNLEELVSMLSTTERWDKILSGGQQQRLAFARVLLHRPKWVFLDEATSALDDANEGLVMGLFTTELEDTAVLSIGHRPTLPQYHTRSLQLITTPRGRVLTRPRKPTSPFWKTMFRVKKSKLETQSEPPREPGQNVRAPHGLEGTAGP